MGWLHARTGWSLFVRTADDVARIRPGRGRVTWTAVPALQSSGPVSFVATRSRVFVHPIDAVTAYTVRDDRPAHPLWATQAREGGVVLPGPGPRTIWVSRGSRRLVLLRQDGSSAGRRLRWPAGAGLPVADGRGYAVVQTTAGVYAVGPGGARRVARGTMLATGAGRVLAGACHGSGTCRTVLVDLATGRHHTFSAHGRGWAEPGVISPDGRRAAIPRRGVTLVDLATGASTPLRPSADVAQFGQAMVWSPDSRWLFVAQDGSSLRAYDVQTGTSRTIQLPEPALQVAVRPGR
jgi:hypothetical protein